MILDPFNASNDYNITKSNTFGKIDAHLGTFAQFGSNTTINQITTMLYEGIQHARRFRVS